MRGFWIGVAAATLALGAAAPAATLSDSKVGFSADRMVVVNGKTFLGKMWTMPGKERHEQNINGIPAAFIMRADTPIGDVVLPQLHTVVQFVMPAELRVLGLARLTRHPAGHETINGIATTKYDVDETVPEGHGVGSVWISEDGIPMKLAGSFTKPNEKVVKLRWELSHVKTGPQPDSLFEAPKGFSKLPAEAITPLLGLTLKGARSSSP
jgi:hypothetical protein